MTRQSDDRIASNKRKLQSNKWTNRSAHAAFWGFEELGGVDLGFGGRVLAFWSCQGFRTESSWSASLEAGSRSFEVELRQEDGI